MKVRFWGTRGSLPVSLTAPELRERLVHALVAAAGRGVQTPEQARAFVDGLDFAQGGTFGGHSACVQLDGGDADEYLLCDCGSGARAFAQRVMRERAGRPATYHLLMSHLHWDHIMGFPFFTPAYVAGNRVVVHGCHAELEHAFRRQQDAPSFPVPLAALRADIRFEVLTPGESCDIGGFRVTPKLQQHGGDSYGYRIERDGRCVVYSTDSEHKLDDFAVTRSFADFFRDADLVVFDAMYSLAEAVSMKEDWGHSSNVVGVELCQMAQARCLCLFHHEPVADDAALQRLLEETRRFEAITRREHAVEVIAAYDGLEREL
ncbi:MAG TPA: MBL fold metallo-hydrolase [Candidatus Binatia bacterium]|nr:MBL fold metallo-hydrolase [Candidatus Binatia bacterium]